MKNPFIYFNLKIKTALIKRLKKIEFNHSLKSFFSIKKKELKNYNNLLLYFLFAFVIIITFLGRFYFLKYDLYLLSNSWNNDLEAMFNLDRQNWFFPNNNLQGELAYTNFYAKIFDVSPEIALQSMGVFDNYSSESEFFNSKKSHFLGFNICNSNFLLSTKSK